MEVEIWNIGAGCEIGYRVWLTAVTPWITSVGMWLSGTGGWINQGLIDVAVKQVLARLMSRERGGCA